MRLAVLFLFAASSGVGAQTATLRASAELRGSPTASGALIGVVQEGARVRIDETRGKFSHVTLDGFVAASGVSRGRTAGSVRVSTRDRLSIRAGSGTSSTLLALVTPGTTLAGTNKPSGWIRVRRSGWVATSMLDRAVAVARGNGPATKRPARSSVSGGDVAAMRSTASAPRSTTTAPSSSTASRAAAPPRVNDETMPDSTLTPARSTTLRSGPGGGTLGSVGPGATLTPLLRDRDWVRVRLEAWVAERDLRAADTTMATTLSAADLRANPEAVRGRVVRWSVEVLALQTADPMRKDLEPGEPYFLARGPGDENALLYLAIPTLLMEQAKRMPTLSPLIITARVRSGRSQPAGVPVLDLLSIAK